MFTIPEPIGVAFIEVRPDTSQFRAQTDAQVRQAVAGADQLSTSLQRVSHVDLRGTLAPVVAGAGAATAEVAALEAAVKSIPASGIASGLGAGLGDAAAQTEALASSTATLGGTIGTSATAAGALFQKLETAKVAEQGFAGATLESATAARTAAAEETRLFEVRARGTHGQGVGPFRLAGVGLAAGVGIFTAVHALNELSTSLTVSGADALTFQGRMRNLGASLLGGDVVGAFKALTARSHEFNLEQLLLIANTPKAEAALKALGGAGDLAKSQITALQGLTQVAPAVTLRVSQAAFGGDTGDQIAALQAQDRSLQAQIATARKIGGSSDALKIALADLIGKRTSIRGQIAGLRGKGQDSVLAPLVDAVTDARLTGDASKIAASLSREKFTLTTILRLFTLSADERRGFKTKLLTVDQELEAAQQQIKDEAARHRQAMVQAALDPSELAVAEAQASGNQGGLLAGLQGERAVLEDTLKRKDLTLQERKDFLGQLASVNGQIESIQQQITDEAQRHADAIKQAAEQAAQARVAAREKAHQALIDAFGFREGGLDNALAAAELTKTTADNRRVLEKRLRLFREEARNADLTLAERQAAQGKVIGAEAAIRQLDRDAAQAKRDTIRSKISTEEQRLRDQLTLAGFTEKTIRDDQASLRRLIAFEKRQAHNKKLTVDERRQHLIAEKQYEKDLRDLVKKDDGGAGFQKLAFGFLTEQRGFAANLAGNLLGSTSGLVGGSAPSAPPAPPPSPLPRGSEVEALRATGGKGPSGGQLDTLIHLARQQLGQLQALRAGGAHPEARTSRALAHSGTEVGAA